MADKKIQVKEAPVSQRAHDAERIESGSIEKKRWLKGGLAMAICCAAPLLLLAAIPFLAAAFGSLASPGNVLLGILALAACPVGMFVMMRIMMKDKK